MNKKLYDITCVQCDNPCTTDRKNGKYCSAQCNRDFHNKKNGDVRRIQNNLKYEDVPKCKICDFEARVLINHIIKTHKLSLDEYKEKFNVTDSAIYHPSYLETLSNAIKGENNPAYGHDGKFSPYSKKFIHYENYNEEEKNLHIKNVAKKTENTRSENGNDTTTLQYYLNRGFSETDAKEELSKRQKTFSLDICIEKYGELLGTEIWAKRQHRWMETLNGKTEEERLAITKKKMAPFGTSGIATELFREVTKQFPERTFIFGDKINMQREYVMLNDTTSKYYRPDFIDLEYQKIIEFNGDYWHGNPVKYKADGYCKFKGKRFSQIWEEDSKKLKFYTYSGLTYLIIWERDYRRNKQKVVEQCVEFLKA